MHELSFHRLLLQTREQRADNLAFVEGEVSESVAEHVDSTLRLAAAFRSAGVPPGARIAVLADASRRFVNVLHAAALGGWIAAPLNIRLAVPELADLLRHCEPALVVVDQAHLPALVDALTLLDAQPRIVLIGPSDPQQPDVSRLEDMIDAADPDIPAEPTEDTNLLVLYTGGTTGTPKGALCNNRQLVLSLHRIQFQMDHMASGAAMISMNPLFHIGAINAVYAFPSAGSTVVIHPRFEATRVLEDAARHRITHLSAVVAILGSLMDSPDFSASLFPALRYVIYGANPIPRDLLARVMAAFPNVDIQQSYGMTEAFGGVTFLSGDDHRLAGPLLGSVGRSLPGVIVTVRDDTGAEVPRGHSGEVCIASGSVADTYLGGPPASGAGYLRTGDAGRLDGLGYLYLLDRIKDMIKTGGENVYSVEVEVVLAAHPDVETVAVIGLPDDQWGERVHAVVVARTGSDLTPDELRAFARRHLAGFKLPKTIDIRTDPLPTSSVGKVLKRVLRSEYLAAPVTATSDMGVEEG